MISKKHLEFFKEERTSDEVTNEFGFKTGCDILKEFIEEGIIDKNLKLTNLGKRKLDETGEEENNNKKRDFFKHPLFIVVVSVLLTAFFTYIITINSINHEDELTVSFIGENEISVLSNQTIPFNSITIYNPTGKKVSLKDMYVERPNDWIKYQPTSLNQKPSNESLEVTYNTPTLIGKYEPYMVIDSGETELMSGQFNLVAPYRKGVYELNFCVETLDGKKYYIDRRLIVEVK